jgi:hypothetical protein
MSSRAAVSDCSNFQRHRVVAGELAALGAQGGELRVVGGECGDAVGVGLVLDGCRR